MSGTFNASNVLGVLGVLLASGVDLHAALAALARVTPPPGRMQRLGGDGRPLVVVDYAHTPDALDKVLAALRPAVEEGGALVCVFGCGGERDPGKRPEMGRIAAERADVVIVTDDNPRGEDPAAIAAAIVDGHPCGGPERISPSSWIAARRSAPRWRAPGRAMRCSWPARDTSTYQERNGVRTPFSDVDTAAAAAGADAGDAT